MRKSERESNVELLRIICMCLIIAHHFVLHGGLVNQTESANWIIAIIFYPGGKICFDTFLIISYWYLCEQRFRAKRFFSVYLLTLFYSVMVGGIAFGIYNVEHTSYDVLSVFLPITGNVHGFASAYLVVYALLPFYNYIQYKISKRQHIYIIGVFFLTNCFSYWVFDLVDHVQKITSNVAFFTLFYFLCAYFRKYGIGVFGKIYFDIMLFLVGWIAMASLYAYVKLNPNSFWMKYLLSINQGHTGIIPISSGIALFFIFKNLKIKHNRLVNLLAMGAFPVLMIHDHNFFRKAFWNEIIKVHELYDNTRLILVILLVVVITYMVGTVIELVRVQVFNILIFNRKIPNLYFSKLENLLKIDEDY